MQMTWMGAPTIYYGDEAGLCGFTDPDNRRTYPWGREDWDMIHFHKDIIRIRKGIPALRKGSMKYLDADYNYLAYARFDREDQCVVLVNNNDHEITKRVSVWEAGTPKEGTMVQLLITDDCGYSLENREYEIRAGKIEITLPKTSAVVLKCKRETE